MASEVPFQPKPFCESMILEAEHPKASAATWGRRAAQLRGGTPPAQTQSLCPQNTCPVGATSSSYASVRLCKKLYSLRVAQALHKPMAMMFHQLSYRFSFI